MRSCSRYQRGSLSSRLQPAAAQSGTEKQSGSIVVACDMFFLDRTINTMVHGSGSQGEQKAYFATIPLVSMFCSMSKGFCLMAAVPYLRFLCYSWPCTAMFRGLDL